MSYNENSYPNLGQLKPIHQRTLAEIATVNDRVSAAVANHTHSDKTDKPSSATTDNLAAFDSNKNPVDSGIAKGDVVTKIANPTADNLIAQDANGKIADSGISKDDVATKAEIVRITENVFSQDDFEQGVINPEGTNTENSARVRTKGRFKDIGAVGIADGYSFAICCYNASGQVPPRPSICYYNYNTKSFQTSGVVMHDCNIIFTDADYAVLGDYNEIRFIVRRADGADLLPSEAANAIFAISKTNLLNTFCQCLQFLQNKGSALAIANPANSSNGLWSQWSNRLAFGMNPATAPVPLAVNGQFYVDGTIISHNNAGQNKNRWGLHVYEAYSQDNYSRMTMLLDKHTSEIDGLPSFEIYYYTGADHSASSYGYTKIGSDVQYHSFFFSRDKFVAVGDIDARFPITLARLNPAALDDTYSTVAEADAAYEPEANAAQNLSCLKYISLQNADNGAMYYDSALHKVACKINGVWRYFSTTAELETALGTKIDTAGTGLSKSGTTLNHSNSVTAKSNTNIAGLSYDAQGHVTGAGTEYTVASSFSNSSTDTELVPAKKFYSYLFKANDSSYGNQAINNPWVLANGISSDVASVGGNTVYMVANGLYFTRIVFTVKTGQTLTLAKGTTTVLTTSNANVSNTFRSPLFIAPYTGSMSDYVGVIMQGTSANTTNIDFCASKQTTLEEGSYSIAGVFFSSTSKTYS